MITALRARWNEHYSDAGYRAYIEALTQRVGCPIEFRLSETPCFFPRELLDQLVDAS